MCRRAVIGAGLVAALLLAARPAAGHRMMAASLVREDGTVLLQAFFRDGTPARGVKVQLTRPDGSSFTAGETDGEGKLIVAPDEAPGRWTAVFTGSMGHRAETQFTLGVPGPQQPPQRTESPPAAREDLARAEPFPWRDVLAGLGFVFGLSALLMCLKLRREIRSGADRPPPS
jgi:hypothetical protein